MTAIPGADADSGPDLPPDPFEEVCDAPTISDASDAITAIDGDATEAAIDAVTGALRTGGIELQVPEDRLADRPEVHQVETDGTPFTSVTYRIGGDHLTPSNLTVVLDQDGSIVSYNEALYRETSAGTFQVQAYAEGELVLDEKTDIPTAVESELPRYQDGGSDSLIQSALATASTQSSASTAACVSLALGVPGAVGALVAKTCTAACAAAWTPPGATVCAACIGAAAVLGTGAAAAAVSCFR
jgi:hypothetical protein